MLARSRPSSASSPDITAFSFFPENVHLPSFSRNFPASPFSKFLELSVSTPSFGMPGSSFRDGFLELGSCHFCREPAGCNFLKFIQRFLTVLLCETARLTSLGRKDSTEAICPSFVKVVKNSIEFDVVCDGLVPSGCRKDPPKSSRRLLEGVRTGRSCSRLKKSQFRNATPQQSSCAR
jgi:hypothetical protein